jgi:hypothetical protein
MKDNSNKKRVFIKKEIDKLHELPLPEKETIIKNRYRMEAIARKLKKQTSKEK